MQELQLIIIFIKKGGGHDQRKIQIIIDLGDSRDFDVLRSPVVGQEAGPVRRGSWDRRSPRDCGQLHSRFKNEKK